MVTDLGSTNGTYIGAVRIERAIVPPGTLVKLGGTTIRFDDAVRRDGSGPRGARSELVGMIAVSPQMLRLFADIERVATTPTSVLIVGESGTGKERVAEAMHARSGRAREPLRDDRLRRAVVEPARERAVRSRARRVHRRRPRRTPARSSAPGNGTVFLDEIGELPAADQSALLGVLERQRFRRVGGTVELELGARVIAATNRDLRAEVNTGRFRHDLYHRLAVVVLRLLPLRERREDIPLLVEHFARELGAIGTLERRSAPSSSRAGSATRGRATCASCATPSRPRSSSVRTRPARSPRFRCRLATRPSRSPPTRTRARRSCASSSATT